VRTCILRDSSILTARTEIAGQVIIVFVGGAAFQVTSIDGREWGISLALGIVSIPLGALIRLMPTAPFEKLFIMLRLLPNPEVLPTTREEWNPAIEQVRDNLSMFANIRGGRVRASSFVGKSRKSKLRANNPAPMYEFFRLLPGSY
jgi:Ca2+-transporting ATPase